ncbi:hypothetical protein MUK42_18378, partial [Musa troglodytarum]
MQLGGSSPLNPSHLHFPAKSCLYVQERNAGLTASRTHAVYKSFSDGELEDLFPSQFVLMRCT